MDVQAADSVFVRTSRRTVHPVLEQVALWGSWWPGMTTEPVGSAVLVRLRPPGLLRARQRFVVEVASNRREPPLGLLLRCRGDVTGEAELYYLDEPAGCVVTYLLRASVTNYRWRATLAGHRAGMRAGLETLKERLEAGRIPGDEPDAALLRHQLQAHVDFRPRGPRRPSAAKQ
jgi:hypothetical protein